MRKRFPSRCRLAMLILVPLLLALGGCGPEAPADLQQAASVIHYLMRPDQLSRSAFFVAYPEGTPSQFVSCLFSLLGTAEWPGKGAFMDELQREQLRAIGAPVQPPDVTFVPVRKNPGRGRQLVVGFADERKLVVVEGYLDPKEDPVLRCEWNLPRVEPAPGVAEIYRSNQELSITSQAF